MTFKKNQFKKLSQLIFLFFTLLLGYSEAKDPYYFRDQIDPILQTYCYSCHDEDIQKGDLRLDTLNPDLLNASNADLEHWHDALNYLQIGEMPPAKKKQPSTQERRMLIDWLSEQLKLAEKKYTSDEDKIRFKRLTRYEYNNTMRDLLGLEMDFTEGLPIEGASAEGFKNSSKVLSISPIQYEYYLKNARKGIESALFLDKKPETVEIKFEKPTENKFVADVVAKYDPDKKVTILSPKNYTMYCQVPNQLNHLYPYKGDIRVLIRASVSRPANTGIPSMKVSLGCKPGGVVEPVKQLGKLVELDLKPNEIKEFEFIGRIEEFPSNVLEAEDKRFSGFFLKIKNVYDNGNIPAVTYTDKKKKLVDYPTNQLPDIHIHSVQVQFPYFQTWPPASHTNLLKTSKVDSKNARSLIKDFAQKAFRGPVTTFKINEYYNYFKKIRPNFTSIEQAIAEVFISILISPRFLYHVELPKENDQKLSEFEFANRLSYFLWNSMPDSKLFELAQQNKLSKPNILKQQVQRMIHDDRFNNFVENFGSQWLGLDKIDQVAINPLYYRDFDVELKHEMVKETTSFIRELFTKNLSMLNVIDSDFSMLNMKLAHHYGINGAKSSQFKAVALKKEDQRGGILSHGSILLANSNGEDSHPIKRAVWLLDSILGTPPGNPPADVPELESENPDLSKLSLKKQLELHRKKESCNDCHYKLDPWGIAFENFDAIGNWRTKVRRIIPVPHGGKGKTKHISSDVDSKTELPDGQKINDIADLKQYLLKHKKSQFASAFTNKLLTFALGRSLLLSEKDIEASLTQTFIHSDYKFKNLVQEMVASPVFMKRQL